MQTDVHNHLNLLYIYYKVHSESLASYKSSWMWTLWITMTWALHQTRCIYDSRQNQKSITAQNKNLSIKTASCIFTQVKTLLVTLADLSMQPNKLVLYNWCTVAQNSIHTNLYPKSSSYISIGLVSVSWCMVWLLQTSRYSTWWPSCTTQRSGSAISRIQPGSSWMTKG